MLCIYIHIYIYIFVCFLVVTMRINAYRPVLNVLGSRYAYLLLVFILP